MSNFTRWWRTRRFHVRPRGVLTLSLGLVALVASTTLARSAAAPDPHATSEAFRVAVRKGYRPVLNTLKTLLKQHRRYALLQQSENRAMRAAAPREFAIWVDFLKQECTKEGYRLDIHLGSSGFSGVAMPLYGTKGPAFVAEPTGQVYCTLTTNEKLEDVYSVPRDLVLLEQFEPEPPQ